MKKKKQPDETGYVYSTDPEFEFRYTQPEEKTLPPDQQKLAVRIERKHRAGKEVTIISGFKGTSEDLEILGKELKTSCGVGGSAKEGEIILQGDQRNKVLELLRKKGFVMR